MIIRHVEVVLTDASKNVQCCPIHIHIHIYIYTYYMYIIYIILYVESINGRIRGWAPKRTQIVSEVFSPLSFRNLPRKKKSTTTSSVGPDLAFLGHFDPSHLPNHEGLIITTNKLPYFSKLILRIG